METHESPVKIIKRSQEDTYNHLSDLRRLEERRDMLPPELDSMAVTEDSLTFEAKPLGDVTLRIIEREPCKTLKFGVDNIPVQANMWIQFLPHGENESLMKITVKADIPMMLKPLVGKKFQPMVEKLAESLAEALNK